MKIKRQERITESSLTSIEILTDSIENYFKRHPELNSQQRFYPENPRSVLAKKSSEKIDVILFGNAFKSLMNSGMWPLVDLRLWCLSHRFKKYISALFPEIRVQVIPRRELFPVSKNITHIHDWKSPFDLVFAGRISAQKNIEALIYTTFFLQRKAVPCTLHLMGDFDDHYHEHLGRRRFSHYKDRIHTLISSLTWEYPPVIHSKRGVNDWVNHPFNNPVAVSFSTFFCEDFGVSLAQANQRGWPIICTDFGGHADIESENILKIPSSIHSHLPLNVIEALSFKMAELLYDEKFQQVKVSSDFKVQNLLFSSIETLDKARRLLALKLGEDANTVALEELSTFADSSSGSLIIGKIIEDLDSEAPSYSIILFDCDDTQIRKTELIRLKKALNEIPDNAKINFLSSKNIFYKDQIKILMKSQKIFVILDKALQERIIYVLQEQLGLTSLTIKSP
jgi:glycosyltransferase involved in cell wall biosynthesis